MSSTKQKKVARPKKQFSSCSPSEFYKIYSHFLKLLNLEAPPFTKKAESTYFSFCRSCHELIGVESLGLNFITDYFSFTIGKYIDKELDTPVSFSFICNKTQLRKFFERTDQHDYVINQMTSSISKQEVKNWFIKESPDHPEIPKKRQNLSLCYVTGAIYDEEDKLCQTCPYNKECSKF